VFVSSQVIKGGHVIDSRVNIRGLNLAAVKHATVQVTRLLL
jgi:hypothetical protein